VHPVSTQLHETGEVEGVLTSCAYYRKIRLDFRHATAFWAMLRSFSGKSGMAMRGLSFGGIFSGTS
jgi:hypothetical protein